MRRREFLASMAAGAVAAPVMAARQRRQPNIVFVFADQWRAQATGYSGDPNVITPNLDRLAAQSVNFTHAVSGCPVCTPYRGSLMTGQYWLTHGLFVNDVPLDPNSVTVAKVLAKNGYDTGYIGKWHIDGHGRSSFTPPARRQGFQFWRALECTHDYNNSAYYADTDQKLTWSGYDSEGQTDEACRYIHDRASSGPFALFLSYGPPHDPYETAPEEYRRLYETRAIKLRANVPAEFAGRAEKDLRGYYAHIAALDACAGRLLRAIDSEGIGADTIFVFTSDHGDLLSSHGQQKKQQPYDESIRVPFLVRYPAALEPREVDTLLNTPDIMPTLLGLCGVDVPGSVEGADYGRDLIRGRTPDVDGALLMCVTPFGQWTREKGGREYRGVRTERYTFVRDLNGPWLLFDNKHDPCQLNNLCNKPGADKVQARLEKMLAKKLEQTRDEFKPGDYYVQKWGYKTDKTGTVPYTP
ncbi:MAG: sulfatase [Candidatus Hydrogenedentes bacterium]|nr:sulfatase [Candidatus Hydrogenedentota bacterium]